jgi:hypothetical protein
MIVAGLPGRKQPRATVILGDSELKGPNMEKHYMSSLHQRHYEYQSANAAAYRLRDIWGQLKQQTEV